MTALQNSALIGSSHVGNCWKCLTIGMSEIMHRYPKEALEDLQKAVNVVRRDTGSVPGWLSSPQRKRQRKIASLFGGTRSCCGLADIRAAFENRHRWCGYPRLRLNCRMRQGARDCDPESRRMARSLRAGAGGRPLMVALSFKEMFGDRNEQT
jgi:hypothetical protein